MLNTVYELLPVHLVHADVRRHGMHSQGIVELSLPPHTLLGQIKVKLLYGVGCIILILKKKVKSLLNVTQSCER